MTITEATPADPTPAEVPVTTPPFIGKGERLGGGKGNDDDPDDKEDHIDDSRDGGANDKDEEKKEEDEEPTPESDALPPGEPSPGGEDILSSIPRPIFDSGRGVGLPLGPLLLPSDGSSRPDDVISAEEELRQRHCFRCLTRTS